MKRSARGLVRSNATGILCLTAALGAGAAGAQTMAVTAGPRESEFAVPLEKDPQRITKLKVLKQYDLNLLKTNPKVVLQGASADFTPLFRDRRSLVNVAARLRALPQHVEVTTETAQVTEVAEGVILRQELSYRIRPGRCADASARAALETVGASCFARRSMNERIAAFSTPGNLRYVADPALRSKAIADFKARTAEADAMVNEKVRAVRGLIADSAKRQAYVKMVGPAEAQRITALNDDQLKDELINTAEFHVEQTLFVPRAPGVNLRASPASMRVDAPASPLSPRLKGDIEATTQSEVKLIDTLGTKVSKVDLPQYIYLTGFTLSNHWEWDVRAGFTVNWCLIVDCKESYWIEPHASFDYGFGLRFPISTNLHYERHVHPNNVADAKVIVDFTPIDGSAAQYAATGIPADQVFAGKELVAQFDASAGFDYKLPIVGPGGITAHVGKDFTDWLPAPFTHGQFAPPPPGSATPGAPIVFNQLDLLGGVANFGVAGVQVFPAVDVSLVSNGLTFTLTDEINQVDTRVTRSGQAVSVGVEPSGGRNSRFSLEKPTYNVGFQITPGVDAHAFLDIAVWSHDWDWYVWFPQIAVELPPNGAEFTCHAHTVCTRHFYTPGDPDPYRGVKEHSGDVFKPKAPK